jgi:4-hydroxyphenylpyruvate dioxygenase-like putative hemolysin
MSRCQFIEFAVSEDRASDLARLVSGLGFRKVVQHKSKAVTRWRGYQGFGPINAPIRLGAQARERGT